MNPQILAASRAVRQAVANYFPPAAPKLNHLQLAHAVGKDLAAKANLPNTSPAKAGWNAVSYVLPVVKSSGALAETRFLIGRSIFLIFGNSAQAELFGRKAIASAERRTTVQNRVAARQRRRG